MRVAILCSGGKDSAYAAWWAMMQGWETVAIITIGIKGDDSMMFQIPGTFISAFQSVCMNVPWLPVESSGKEDLEILDLKNSILGKNDNLKAYNSIWPEHINKHQNIDIFMGKLKIDALVTGALRSDYQKTRIERMCESLGIISFSPLWHKDPIDHMNSLIELGFEIKFISVSCEGLDEEWLGTSLTKDNLLKLIKLSNQFRFNLDGEGGEFETITVSGPHMRNKIKCTGKIHFKSGRGLWEIEEADITQC